MLIATTHEIFKLATMQIMTITVVLGLPRSIRILAASIIANYVFLVNCISKGNNFGPDCERTFEINQRFFLYITEQIKR